MSSTQVVTTKKTVGTTTLSATGGSVVGGAIAAIVLYFFPQQAQVALLAPLTIVFSTVCALAGGYLAPSKAEALEPYLAQASEDIAQRVATKVPKAGMPSAQEVAAAVAERTEPKPTVAATGQGSYVGQHATPESAPAAVEPGLTASTDQTEDAEEYPDLDALAKVDAV